MRASDQFYNYYYTNNS